MQIKIDTTNNIKKIFLVDKKEFIYFIIDNTSNRVIESIVNINNNSSLFETVLKGVL